jgi:hypothetical protein
VSPVQRLLLLVRQVSECCTDTGSIPVSRTRGLAGQILYLGRLRIRRGKYVENATIPVPLPVTA